MFGVDTSELLLIVLVAIAVIGPKELPRVMRTVGQWVGKARAMASQFRVGVDQMMRESEIAELEKKWREQNEAIMKAHPAALIESDWGKPAPPPEPAAEPVMLEKMSKPAPIAPAMDPAAAGPAPAKPSRRAPRAAPELP